MKTTINLKIFIILRLSIKLNYKSDFNKENQAIKHQKGGLSVDFQNFAVRRRYKCGINNKVNNPRATPAIIKADSR